MSGNVALIVAIVAGLWVVPALARFAPELVNGLLVLMIVGVILFNSDRWIPVMNSAAGAFRQAIRPGT